jgi:hypothetical protein
MHGAEATCKKMTHRSFRAYTAISVIVLALVCIIYIVVERIHFNHEICSYNQDAKTKECAYYHLLPFIGIEVFKTLNDYSVVINTLGTAFIAGFTGTLWIATKRLSEEGRKQIQVAIRAAEAAENAANAANSQVALSREAMITTERAFVYCQRIEAQWQADKETGDVVKWTFTPIWKNSGNTPTRRANNCIGHWLAINAGDIPNNFDFSLYNGIGVDTMLGPGATMHGRSMEISTETLQLVRANNAHAYIWGWFDYDDVFKETARHRAEFCLEIQVVANPNYKDGGFRYRMHGDFNGFDDDCFCKPGEYR